MEVVIYTQDSCGSCHHAMDYLSRHNVKFTEKNISHDNAARDELIAKGFKATPVIIAGTESMVGFSEPKLRKMLGL